MTKPSHQGIIQYSTHIRTNSNRLSRSRHQHRTTIYFYRLSRVYTCTRGPAENVIFHFYLRQRARYSRAANCRGPRIGSSACARAPLCNYQGARAWTLSLRRENSETLLSLSSPHRPPTFARCFCTRPEKVFWRDEGYFAWFFERHCKFYCQLAAGVDFASLAEWLARFVVEFFKKFSFDVWLVQIGCLPVIRQ